MTDVEYQVTVDPDSHNASAEPEHVDSGSDAGDENSPGKSHDASPSDKPIAESEDSKRKGSARRKQSTNSLAGGNLDGKSRGSRIGRSASFMAAEFHDDSAREKNHLREANAALEDRLKSLRAQCQELKTHGLSSGARKNMADLEEDNEIVRKDIDALRAKVGAASSIETLDKLTDEIAGKQAELKYFETIAKDLAEENYANAKLVRDEGKNPNPQAVFLDLKNERRRFEKRLEKSRKSIEKSRDAHKSIQERLRGVEEEEKSLGLDHLTHDEIVSTQKKFENNEKELEKLRRKLVSFEGTFSVRSMQTARKSNTLAEEVTELQGQVRSLEAQVMKLEATIMQNQKLHERPPHFIEPMELKTPPTVSLSGTAGAGSPRPMKPAAPPPSKSPRAQQGAPAKKANPAPPKKQGPKRGGKPPATSKPSADDSLANSGDQPHDRPPQPNSGSLEASTSAEGKLNDLDSPARSPTPTRSPTPPATPPLSKSPAPPATSRPTSAAPRTPQATTPTAKEASQVDDTADDYEDEGFDEPSPPKPDGSEDKEPAFLTE